MDVPFEKRYFRIPRAEIAHLRFILESYDGLAFLRTLDSRAALVEIAFPPSRKADAEELLEALGKEISITPEAAPSADAYRPL